jgi:hypothetical protein
MDIKEFKSLDDTIKVSLLRGHSGIYVRYGVPSTMTNILSTFESDNYRCQALSIMIELSSLYPYQGPITEILSLFKDENRRIQALEAMSSLLHKEKSGDLIMTLKSFSAPNRAFEAVEVMIKHGCSCQLIKSYDGIYMLFVNTTYSDRVIELLSKYEGSKDKQKENRKERQAKEIEEDFVYDSLDDVPCITTKEVHVSHKQTYNGESKTDMIDLGWSPINVGFTGVDIQGLDIPILSRRPEATGFTGVDIQGLDIPILSRRPINIVGLTSGEMQRDDVNIISHGTSRLLNERISLTSNKQKFNEVKGLPTEPVAKEQHKREVEDITDDTPDEKKCTICWEALRTYHLSPCNHVCLCTNCVINVCKGTKLCPICRTTIKKINYLILS